MIRTPCTGRTFSVRDSTSQRDKLNGGEGEFLLSRDRRALMPPSNVAAIVTGTYATSYDKVYMSIKLVSATEARIIAGADFVVRLHDVAGLLHQHVL